LLKSIGFQPYSPFQKASIMSVRDPYSARRKKTVAEESEKDLRPSGNEDLRKLDKPRTKKIGIDRAHETD
jgi:hypothetical protein